MSMWIEAKVGGGTPIEEATRDACDLAARLGFPVHFKFNDVSCWAEPYGVTPEEFAARLKLAVEGTGHRVCTNRVMPSVPTSGVKDG